MPQQLKDIFANINGMTNDETFSFAKRAYFSLKQEYIKAKGGVDGGQTQWETFSGPDRNDLKLHLLDSSFSEEDATRFASKNSSVSANRNLGSIFPNLSSSELTDSDMIKDGILKVLEISDNFAIQRFFGFKVDGKDTENIALGAWLDQQGFGNFSTAMINDPYIVNEIMKGVKYRALNHGLNLNKPEEAFLSAVKSELFNMSGQLSLNKDKNGVAYLMLGPSIERVAQSQIPNKYPLQITKNDLIADMLSQYNKSFGGGSQNEFIKDAIENGDIMFVPNNEKIGQPTFRVVAFAQDGTNETLAENYRWQWENSQLNEDYYDALEKISDGGVRKLLGSFDFMAKNNLDAVMESIKNNRDQADTWINFINTYNKLAYGVNNLPTSPSNILPIINYVKSEKGIEELKQFFDDKRMFRFDLR